MRRLACSLTLPLLLALLATAASAAERQAPSSVQDLQYGEALFYYFQEDWFNSIVRLEIARAQQRLPNHGDEAELLLGGLGLSYGLRNTASEIFERLLTEAQADAQTRNRALFYLARISYQRGDTARALQALSQISGDRSRATRAEADQLHSLLLLQLGRDDAAVDVLQAAKAAGSWSPYLAYNLGVACIRSGQPQCGERELDTLGDMDARSDELRLLRDKANLALGYSYLQAGDPKQARARLERVRLEGPLSSKALLGTGWADAEAAEFGRSLVPWGELGTRSATDPAVQEALLAVPYAMARMNLHGQAVHHYNAAIATLFEEHDRLDGSIAAIRSGELLELLQQQDLRGGSGWLQALTLDIQSPALRYQVELMAAHEFQEAVKNYRDLLVLRNNLQDWAAGIDAYDDMVSARQARFADNRPAAERALRSDDHERLQHRQRELNARLAQVEATSDPVGLADATEAGQWLRIQDIKRRLAGTPESPGSDALRERLARVEGALYWQLSSQYRPRLWQTKRQLVDVAGRLDLSAEALQTLHSTRLTTPDGFASFRGRIDAGRETTQALLARTASIQLAQGELIEQLAVNALEQQKKRLDTYIVQARFSLAQTYDHARFPDGEGEQ